MPTDIPDNWTPTPAAINALLEPLRRFIIHLETRSDPAGDVRALHVARENAEALAARVAELETSWTKATAEADAWRFWASKEHGSPLRTDDAAREHVDSGMRFVNQARARLQNEPCSSGCLPTGKGFAHLRTIDLDRAYIRLTPTIDSLYSYV